jgi:hypothetical protein
VLNPARMSTGFNATNIRVAGDRLNITGRAATRPSLEWVSIFALFPPSDFHLLYPTRC